MRAKFYPDELKAEAVRLVVERRFTAGEAGLRLGIPSEAVRVWVRRYRYTRMLNLDVDLSRARLKRVVMERDALVGSFARLLDKTG